jgi:hypothetical protein
VGLPLFLLGVFLALRLPGLGRGITIDEVYWLNRSALFTQAISAGDWDATVLSGHPGVTTMWAGTLGIRATVRDIERLNLETISDFHLRHALRQRGINPVEVIAAGRLFVVLLNAAAFTAIWVYGRRLFGWQAAGLALALLALDPFVAGHQRLLHQDGLMTSFCLPSLLAFAAFVKSGRGRDAAVSGAAAGLAWLTKSPTLVLAPVIVLMGGWAWRTERSHLRKLLAGLGIWLGVAAAVFVLLWPAMLATPLEALGSTWEYALGSAGGEFSGPIFFNGNVYPDGDLGWASAYFYPLSFVWRSTPFVILGLLAALVSWIIAKMGKGNETNEPSLGLPGLLAFALLFALGMSLAVKKFDRYLLPAHGALIVVAGWGWWQLLSRWPAARAGARRWAMVVAAAMIIGGQAFSSVNLFPYYLSYYNPMLGGPQKAQAVMMIGWGEGLDQAAVYLREQRGLDGEAVASWYSNLFNLSFDKDAGDIPIAIELQDEALADLLAKEYLVVYVHQWQRETPRALLAELSGREPEYSVWVNGLEYVRVYKLGD